MSKQIAKMEETFDLFFVGTVAQISVFFLDVRL